MTRRLSHFLTVALAALALLAALPLAAQTPEPAEPQPMEAEPPAEGEPVERSEEGTLSGTIVLLDADNLIVETAEGDRAFSIREESTLPAELRRSEDWASFRGTPVRITFAPGEEGELRIVRTVSIVDDGTTATTTAATTAGGDEDVAAAPLSARTDLADESDVVEPDDVATTTTTGLDDDTAGTTLDGRATGQAIAEANPDEQEEVAAAALADDDDLPPAADTMASLPATASPLPWLALIGTLALGAALALGRFQRLRQRVISGGTRG